MNKKEQIEHLQEQLAEAEKRRDAVFQQIDDLRSSLDYLENRAPAFAALLHLFNAVAHDQHNDFHADRLDHHYDETNRNWSGTVDTYQYTRTDGTLIATLTINKRTPK